MCSCTKVQEAPAGTTGRWFLVALALSPSPRVRERPRGKHPAGRREESQRWQLGKEGFGTFQQAEPPPPAGAFPSIPGSEGIFQMRRKKGKKPDWKHCRGKETAKTASCGHGVFQTFEVWGGPAVAAGGELGTCWGWDGCDGDGGGVICHQGKSIRLPCGTWGPCLAPWGAPGWPVSAAPPHDIRHDTPMDTGPCQGTDLPWHLPGPGVLEGQPELC